jgi:hypothetical protein
MIVKSLHFLWMLENCMLSVLTVTVRVMERNPCAQKYRTLQEVFRAMGTEEE